MITRTCLLFALPCLFVACQSSAGWSVRDAAPGDLKVKSWELSDAPPAGELMVVRCEYDLEVAVGRQRVMRELFVSRSRGSATSCSARRLLPHVPGFRRYATSRRRACGSSSRLRSKFLQP